MAIALATAWVKIRPDLKTFGPEADRGIAKSGVEESGKKHGKKFGAGFALAAGSAMAAAGGFLAFKGVEFFGDIIKEGREAARTSRIVAAAIKSTGGVAHVSASHIEELTKKIGDQAGVDDDVVKAGSAMLLTFRGIRNESGKNNDIFDRANRTLVDMTAALHGGDVSSDALRKQAIQLGKALNDPVKGMTALRRVGVSFTQQQTDQVTALVKSGNTLGAQKIILRELSKEFGGAAAASADSGQKFQARLHNFEESLGTALLPVLNTFVGLLIKFLMPALDSFGKWFADVGAPALKRFAVAAVPIITKFIGVFATGLSTIVKFAVSLPGPVKIAGLAIIAFGIAMKLAAAANPWVLLGVAIVLVVGLIVKNWSKIKSFTGSVWKAVLGFIQAVWDWIKTHWPLLLAILTGPFGLATLFIVRHWGTIKDAAKSFIGWLRTTWHDVIQWVRDRFAWLVDKLLGFFGTILHGAADAFGWIPGLGGKLKTAASKFDQFRKNVNDSIRGINGKTVNVGVEFKRYQAAAKRDVNPNTGAQIFHAAGGLIRGPGGPKGDRIPAMLSDREWVMPAESVDHYGSGFMKAVQKRQLAAGGQVRRFAEGGPVGGEPRIHPSATGAAAIDLLVKHAVYDMAKSWWKQFAGVVGWPFPRKNLSQLRRIDEGQDMQYPGTSPVNVFAILPGRRTSHGGDPGGFGNSYPGEVLDRPVFGFREIYYGHVLPSGRGGHLEAGDVIGRTMGPTSGGDAAGLPNWLEVGFWPPSWANGPAMHRLLLHGSGGGGGAGSARGGSWTVGGMARLWDQAGGPPNLGHLMGAVGMAESGGRAWIRNSIGASGLWQILMPANRGFVHGNVFNPAVNAAAAVAIWAQQGLRAWEAYTNGSYRQFLADGGPVGMARGGTITEPILGIGRSGQRYAFGENGPETVIPGRFSTRRLEERLDRLIEAVERNAHVTAAGVADALDGASQSAALAARYSVG